MAVIEVKHNVEMGHRLSRQPDSKCFHLHGHSWWVHLSVSGPKDLHSGMVIDFAKVKSVFRGFLDTNFDHKLLLNPTDPLITMLQSDQYDPDIATKWGVTTMPNQVDPTVENFAQLIYDWCYSNPFGLVSPRMYNYHVKAFEASTNSASVGDW